MLNRVPILTGIRPAQHPEAGYDRITFDFDGNDNAATPGYSVKYIDKPTADGSGASVDVPGRRYLQIVFTPCHAHNGAGESTVPKRQVLNYPQIESFVVTGDYEGYVTVVIGLDDVVGFQVKELSNRIYIDVAA